MIPPEPVDPREDPELSTDEFRRIDDCCARYERACVSGYPPSIESVLEGWQGKPRQALFRELLAIDIEHREQSGETIEAAALRDRFPDEGDLVELVIREARRSGLGRRQPAVSPASQENPVIPEFLREHPRYRVLRRLAAGGMGDVWLAEHAVLGRKVAIKVIKAELLSDAEARGRFLREAQTAARLSHPNVVTIFDAEAQEASPFLVMEYLEGSDLAQIVRTKGPLTISEACDAIQQGARGLAAAHAAGLVHRDLSPRNLLRTPNGTVKLLDFGLASVSNGAARFPESEAGSLIGSADFMAPEQALDPATSDVRSDLYSLGCVLYYLLTGQPPFPRATLAERLLAHASAPLPDPRRIRRETPVQLALLIERLLAKSPADRVATPDELVTLLEPFCDTGPKSPATRNAGIARRFSRRALVASLVGIGVIGVVWGLWNSERFNPSRGKPDPVERILQESRLLLAQRQESQTRTAIARLNHLLDSHPEFAAGHAQLAEAWNILGDYGWEEADECFPKAIRSATRALELDSDLATAHLALAFAWHTYDCDWERASREYQRAIELDDQQPAAHHWYAWLLAQRQQFDAARAEMRIAHELAPFDLIVMNNVGKIEYFSRRFSEAAQWHRQALDLDPDFRKAHLDLGYTLVELGDIDAALDQLEKATGLSTGNDDIVAAKAYALARSGATESARALLKELEPEADSQRMALEMARVHSALQDTDDAILWLRRAFLRKSPGRGSLLIDPRWDPLRDDTRFQELERQVSNGTDRANSP
ncbi:MAG: protein kinase [Planctomycetota bacterium]|nr:protein kinase [Planctomycetota bacterium]